MYIEDKEFRSVYIDIRPVRVVTKYHPLTQSSSTGIDTMYSSSKMAAVSVFFLGEIHDRTFVLFQLSTVGHFPVGMGQLSCSC